MGGNIVKGGCAALNNNWRNAAPCPQFLFDAEDAREGLTACAEKRAASSKGK